MINSTKEVVLDLVLIASFTLFNVIFATTQNVTDVDRIRAWTHGVEEMFDAKQTFKLFKFVYHTREHERFSNISDHSKHVNARVFITVCWQI